jgi:hypothetical protein
MPTPAGGSAERHFAEQFEKFASFSHTFHEISEQMRHPKKAGNKDAVEENDRRNNRIKNLWLMACDFENAYAADEPLAEDITNRIQNYGYLTDTADKGIADREAILKQLDSLFSRVCGRLMRKGESFQQIRDEIAKQYRLPHPVYEP